MTGKRKWGPKEKRRGRGRESLHDETLSLLNKEEEGERQGDEEEEDKDKQESCCRGNS